MKLSDRIYYFLRNFSAFLLLLIFWPIYCVWQILVSIWFLITATDGSVFVAYPWQYEWSGFGEFQLPELEEADMQGEDPGLSAENIENIKRQRQDREPIGIIYSHSLPKCPNCSTIVRVPIGKTVECVSCGELLKDD